MKNADLLDRMLAGETPETQNNASAEIDQLATLADALADSSSLEPVVMRAEARDALRLELIRQANLQFADSAPPLLTRLRDAITAKAEHAAYSARVATGSTVAAMVLSTGGVAAATERSLPGDLLYGLKLSVEDALSWFAGSDAELGKELLDQARARLDEAVTAAERGNLDSAAEALRLADEHAREGTQELLRAYDSSADTAHLDTLQEFVTVTSRQLNMVEILFTGPASAALDDYRVSLGRVQQRIVELQQVACTDCELGVHDDPEIAATIARGQELDGTPPLPAGTPVDFTEIPAADEPFLSCLFCRAPEEGASAPTPLPEPEPESQEPPGSVPPSSGGGDGSGSGGGSAGGGGGGGGTIPLPDPGPVLDQLPPAVSDPIEEVLDQLPPVESLPTPPPGPDAP